MLTFIVRSKGNPEELIKAFHPIVDSVDRTQPIFHIQPLEQYVSDQLQLFRQYVLMLSVFGALIGLTQLISSQLWGVQATDPLTFALVILGLGAVALLACYVPARRALRVDPAVALRIE